MKFFILIKIAQHIHNYLLKHGISELDVTHCLSDGKAFFKYRLKCKKCSFAYAISLNDVLNIIEEKTNLRIVEKIMEPSI